MNCGVSQYYFEKITCERAIVYAKASRLSLDELWRGAPSGGWSVGQNIEHLALCMQLFRRLLTPALVALKPLGEYQRTREYERYIDNPYMNRKNIVPLPPGTSPAERSASPWTLERLRDFLDSETEKVIALTGAFDSDVAGNIILPDPALGTMNVIQCYQIMFFHEHHHFRFAQRLLAWA